MKDNFFYENKKASIPSIDLEHDKEKVSFAFRTMQGIEKNSNGQQDIPHRHNYYTIIWAKKAYGKHYIDYREYDIKPNKVFFVGPGQVHQVLVQKNATGDVILFTREFLNRYYINEDFIHNLGLFSDVPNTPPLSITPEGAEILENITGNISSAMREDAPFKYERIGAYLKLFLIECNRYAVIPKEDFPEFDQSGKQIVKNFKKLLEDNFLRWHKVSDYAAELSITPDYLNNVLKSAIGKSAKEYIQHRIILEAKRLGVHTSLTSKEISFSLGFDDPSHFSRFYKNIEKESFTTFRQALKEKF